MFVELKYSLPVIEHVFREYRVDPSLAALVLVAGSHCCCLPGHCCPMGNV